MGRGKSGGKKKRGGELFPGVGGVVEEGCRVEDITGTGVSRGVGIAGVEGLVVVLRVEDITGIGVSRGVGTVIVSAAID